MKFIKNLLSAVLAGVMISFGGAVYLACVAAEKAQLGAILFSLGLSVILIMGFLLFTGKTAYILENKPAYIPYLLTIWLGNLLGCALMGVLVQVAKPKLAETALSVCEAKLTQAPWQTLILGALCGILVYIAVDYFRSDEDKKSLPKYLLVFTCIPAFILCGFEHSVADMFYFAASSAYSLYTVKGIVYILLVSAGNLVGAVVFHIVRKLVTK
ncbi:formate/nitrite transporter family protein [Ruminococcus sp.]|uniref:formate/nitrite transporter family protein n=1 Tax=Ruminococcus sp. TaxID=41978 RepID=UPI003890F34C